MLQPGRIDITDEEATALEELRSEHGQRCSLTRRDPGEQGPLVVDFDDKRFLIAEDGTVT